MDSDEDVVVHLLKDHEELYDKNNEHFKDKPRKECFWERIANSGKLSVKVCKTWFESQRTCYDKLKQSKSGQVYIRCKGLSKSPGFKSQACGASASAVSAHNTSRASTDMARMEISMQTTDTTLQPQQVMSPTAIPVHTDAVIIPRTKAVDNTYSLL